jgi:hypothetical protein
VSILPNRVNLEPLNPRMKLRLAGTVNRLNVEHRTSNIERPILMALRFIYFKTSEPSLRQAPLDVLGACLRHELRPNLACRRESSRGPSYARCLNRPRPRNREKFNSVEDEDENEDEYDPDGLKRYRTPRNPQP